MKTGDIRKKFLDYFAAHDHPIVPGSSLVPADDPTLLFTNSGMVQFKDIFLGDRAPAAPRAVTAQRCVRAGGKHNDLENVGYTARHHTFFEMLGNFSFGDYFKREAIEYAWALLTDGFGLPPQKLWVTVFEDDAEAEAIWLGDIGVSKKRFSRIGAADNFWSMGDTGPCGPCSEIFYDHGDEVAGGPPGSADADGDRYVEVWNLVFMQFNRNANGEMSPLPKPSVDTGMGLERVAAILQGKHGNYDIDLFQNLITAAVKALAVEVAPDNQSLRVIADHIRSTAFLLVDGVIPSNEGRGYVLRRIIRRAVRHAYRLGCAKPFMHRLVAPLVDEMGEAYPEIAEARAQVEKVLLAENEKFNETLVQGLKLLDREIAELKGKTISGEAAFRLYDTYGFPLDLTADVARERGLEVDADAFDAQMAAQRSRAQSAAQFSRGEPLRVDGVDATRFDGYQQLHGDAQVMALLVDGKAVDALRAGQSGIVVLDETPFYAESGGQVGDCGELAFDGGAKFAVEDTQYLAKRVIGHIGQVIEGDIKKGARGKAQVAAELRRDCANNHSATHLLHAALKKVLGGHVQQKGSLVAPRRLRFDFSHFEAVDKSQLREIEQLVNRNIRADNEVGVAVMDLDKAKAAGAEALFGEKYDDRVRTIRMGEFSFELCGGTHVARTGEIGFFKIIAESGVAAGIRRIEAVSGGGAEQWVGQQLAALDEAAARVKSTPQNLNDKLQSMLDAQRQQQRDIEALQQKLAGGGDEESVKEINGIKVVAIRYKGGDGKTMRMTVDRWKQKLGSGIVLVAGVDAKKVTLIAGVTADLAARYPAGKLIGEVVRLVDGTGGGKAEFAQGGGAKVDGVDAAVAAAYRWVEDSST